MLRSPLLKSKDIAYLQSRLLVVLKISERRAYQSGLHFSYLVLSLCCGTATSGIVFGSQACVLSVKSFLFDLSHIDQAIWYQGELI